MNHRQLSVGQIILTALMAATTALVVSSNAMAACTISTTPVNFGNYNAFNPAPVDSTGSVTYACQSSDKDITISLDRGGASTFNPRRMLKGSEALSYNLFLDAARTVIWGDGTGGTQIYFDSNRPPRPSVTVTIHSRIPPGQDVTVGTYTNTITATINF